MKITITHWNTKKLELKTKYYKVEKNQKISFYKNKIEIWHWSKKAKKNITDKTIQYDIFEDFVHISD